MTTIQTGHAEPTRIAETISAGPIAEIAHALSLGFSAICECGLSVDKDMLVDDVYTQLVLRLAKIIERGNPTFDRTKFLITVWESNHNEKG